MSPQKQLRVLLGVGVLLLALGATVFFASFPHQVTGNCLVYAGAGRGLPCTEGSLRGALAGAAVAGVGFLVILVPIVAWGVRLGRSLGRSEGD